MEKRGKYEKGNPGEEKVSERDDPSIEGIIFRAAIEFFLFLFTIRYNLRYYPPIVNGGFLVSAVFHPLKYERFPSTVFQLVKQKRLNAQMLTFLLSVPSLLTNSFTFA